MTSTVAVLGVVTATLTMLAAWLQLRNNQRSRAKRQLQEQKLAISQMFASWRAAQKRGDSGSSTRYEPVKTGALTIDVSIHVGNLLTTWPADRVSAFYDSGERPRLPRDLQDLYDKNLEINLTEGRQAGAVMFNGPTYSLRDYRIVIDDPVNESTRLELLFGPTTFFEYLATNQSVPARRLPNRILEALPTMDIHELPLSNQLAVNFSVITLDDQVILQRRSHRVANFPRQLANGVNATMQRGTDGHIGDEDSNGSPDPVGTVLRECQEELGVIPERSSLIVYGIAVDHRHFQPLVVGEVRVPMTFKQVCSNAMAWARDKFEYKNLESLPLDTRKITESLTTDTWVPICALTTLMSLIHYRGRSEVLPVLERCRSTSID